MEKKHAESRLRTLERDFASSSEQFQRDQAKINRQQAQLDQLLVFIIKTAFSSELKSKIGSIFRYP